MYIKWLKWMVVLGALAVAGLRVGVWSIDSLPTPQAAKLPARPPIALADLEQALDAEFAPVVKDGLLKESTGCGVAIGVIDHGNRRVFNYGAARRDSIFEIGSVTKTFTGLALAQLAEQGKVRLDEPVRPLLFADIAAGPAGTEITLLDLATHRSGLPSVPDNLDPKDPSNPFADYDHTALHEFLVSHGTARPADAKYLYSSFGIGLLGYALAQRAGVPYAQLVETEITGPLHMNDTVFALSPEQKQRLMQGHGAGLDPVNAGLREGGLFAGAIGAKSMVDDLLTYLDANLHPERYAAGAAPGSPGATIPAAFALDHQIRGTVKQNTEVALVWLFNLQSGRFEHGGTTPGYTAHVEFAPEQDRGIVVLYNRMDEQPGQERFVDRVAENINELMSGRPAARIDFISGNDPALVALDEFESDL
ncbi:serine hydrolase domain-containing protein [Candidatus Binatus sp.]|uniref:serine hydrolase domain-containing protein n=1 Tax=Candidatus Binatus sp. TaxID=2811406 RepID=UPI003C33C1C6